MSAEGLATLVAVVRVGWALVVLAAICAFVIDRRRIRRRFRRDQPAPAQTPPWPVAALARVGIHFMLLRQVRWEDIGGIVSARPGPLAALRVALGPSSARAFISVEVRWRLGQATALPPRREY